MKFKVEGLDEYIRQLSDLGANVNSVIKQAIYPAVGMVAEAIKRETPVDTGNLRRSVTIEKMDVSEEGLVSADVTFSGTDDKGVANKLKARVLESGRSDQPGRAPNPFIKRAVSHVRKAVEIEIERVFTEEINKIMNKKG